MNQSLIIIDAQQELIDGNQEERAVFNKEQLIRNINLVIEKAKEFGVPIVFVRDLDVAAGKGKGFQVHNEINVPMDAEIFDKNCNKFLPWNRTSKSFKISRDRARCYYGLCNTTLHR